MNQIFEQRIKGISVTLADEYVDSETSPYSSGELARLLEYFPAKYRLELWQDIPTGLKGEVLLEIHREIRQQLIGVTDEIELLESLSVLQMDELADIDADLPLPIINAMILAMDTQRKERYELIAQYPDDTAGGLMDFDATAVREDVSLKVVYRYICKLRNKNGRLPEQLDHLVVIDRQNYVQGVLYLSDLVSLDNDLTVKEVMKTNIPLICVSQKADEVAKTFEDLDLISAPVVNDRSQLIGRITIDDVIDFVRNKADGTVLAQAGLSKDIDIFSPVIKASATRALWLGINLSTAFFAAWVIGLFEASIEQIVALAVLMPVVASMGGIAGGQTLTIVTRGLAIDQINKENIIPLVFHELKISLLNGLLWSLVVFFVSFIWYGNVNLGIVFAFALLTVSLVGTFSGALIPVILNRQGIDPAIAGGVILTTITDSVGFFVFLGTASMILL